MTCWIRLQIGVISPPSFLETTQQKRLFFSYRQERMWSSAWWCTSHTSSYSPTFSTQHTSPTTRRHKIKVQRQTKDCRPHAALKLLLVGILGIGVRATQPWKKSNDTFVPHGNLSKIVSARISIHAFITTNLLSETTSLQFFYDSTWTNLM